MMLIAVACCDGVYMVLTADYCYGGWNLVVNSMCTWCPIFMVLLSP
jgi:hypothetical protein